MIQEKILNEWISELQENFRKFMPPVDALYPETVFVESYDKVQDIDLPQKDFKINSFMRYLHDASRDVMLIILDHVPENKEHFAAVYYLELGIFYALKTEPCERNELYGDYDEEFDPDKADELEENDPDYTSKFAGYHIWLPFLASTISHKCINSALLPEDVFLDKAHDEYEYGFYFAWAINNRDKISTAIEDLQPLVDEALDLLSGQLKKEKFWLIDDDTLKELGEIFFDLDGGRASYYFGLRIAEIEAERRKIKNKAEKKLKAKRKNQKNARKKNRKK